MKHLSTILAIILISGGLKAQISITSEDIDFPLADTAYSIVGETDGVNLPTEGENQNWDYNELTAHQSGEQLPYSFTEPDADPDFVSATAMLQLNLDIGFTILDSRQYFYKSTNGMFYEGNKVQEETINLGAMTFNPDDSIYFPLHKNIYADLSIMPLPFTFEDQWTTTYIQEMPYYLTIAMENLENAPGLYSQHITLEHEVVGFGQLEFPDTEGYAEALLVKTKESYIDSFYLEGEPADPQLLSFVGITQGEVYNMYEYSIWVPGLDVPAIRFTTNSDYSELTAVSYSAEAPQTFTSIDQLGQNTQAGSIIYPNPVRASDEILKLEIKAELNETYRFILTDLQGRELMNQAVSSGLNSLSLPEDIKSGMYIYQLRHKSHKPSKGYLIVE